MLKKLLYELETLLKRKYLLKEFLIVLFTITLISCSASVPKCVKPQMKNLKIKWGEKISINGTTNGFILHSDCSVSAYSLVSNVETKNEIGKINAEQLCHIIGMINKAAIETQALNAPGDTSRFVIFENPETQSFFRGFWNAKYQTYGSKHFREVFDSLESYRNSIK